MSDAYVKVKVVLRQVRTASIMLTKSRDQATWLPCPRSCLHGGSDLLVSKYDGFCPAEVELKVRTWKARELNL